MYRSTPNRRPYQPRQFYSGGGASAARRPPAVAGRRPPRPVAAHRPAITDAAYHLFGEQKWRIGDVARRFPKLPLSADFLQATQCWTQHKNLDSSLPMGTDVPFTTDPDCIVKVEATPKADAKAPSKDKHFARVMLMTTKGEKAHISRRTKFLVTRDATGGPVYGIGGEWDEKKDGANPASDATLIKTAIRTCKDITGIDLSACKEWIKFLEVEYDRASGTKDRTVFFIPVHTFEEEKVMVAKQMTVEEVEEKTSKEEEYEEPAEKEGDPPVQKTRKVESVTKKTVEILSRRSVDVSLNGLLDYEGCDLGDKAFELCLFAESFADMLRAQHAPTLVEKFKPKVAAHEEEQATLKRKREETAEAQRVKAKADEEERDAKRRKLEETKKANEEARLKSEEEEKNMTDEEIRERREAELEKKKAEAEELKKEQAAEAAKKREELEAKRKELEDKRKADLEHQKKFKTVVHEDVDEDFLAALACFDVQPGLVPRTATQLSRDALMAALHGLGTLPKREMTRIAASVKTGNVFDYKAFCTTKTTTEEKIPEEEKKEEKEEKDMAVDK